MHNNFIQKNVPLATKTWFQTGGPARLYCAPTSIQQFCDALKYAHQEQLPFFVLGSGANILISDAGFDGLVIHPHNTSISHLSISNTTAHVTAGAGTEFHDLICYCLDNNLIGLEEFSGIPGTVGGSVFINIHYFSFLLSQFLVSAQVFNTITGTLETVDNNWFNFGYDYSTLHKKEHYLLEATFELTQCSDLEAAFARGRHTEIIRHRRQRYPNSHTCGSFFRNFNENEVSLVSNGKKMIYTAYYLDKTGVKGELAHGDATVSYQHANMIVNQGDASSNDIIQLARTMQTKVYDNFGIIPQPECQLIGFNQYPLLKAL
jgi:UDP-N-acetylmuramate dehydrogenase